MVTDELSNATVDALMGALPDGSQTNPDRVCFRLYECEQDPPGETCLR